MTLYLECLVLDENIIKTLQLWRNNEITRKYSKNKDFITYDKMQWILEIVYFMSELKPYIAKINNEPIGFIGFIKNDKDIFISININPNFRGNGYGSAMLKRVLEKIDKGVTIKAEIIKDNIASIKLFEKCGFELINTKNDLFIFQWVKKD